LTNWNLLVEKTGDGVVVELGERVTIKMFIPLCSSHNTDVCRSAMNVSGQKNRHDLRYVVV